MKLKNLIVIGTLSAVSSFAAAGGFDGPFVQAGIGVANSETKISGTGTVLDDSYSQTSLIGSISAGYSQSFGNFNLAASAYYIIGDQNAGEATFTNGAESITLKSKGTNTWGIAIEPGWNLAENALVYAKLGYTETKGEATAIFNTTDFSGTEQASQKYRGYLYGVGAKYKFTPNIYGVVEVIRSEYNDKDGIEPSAVAGTIGIGYKF